MVFQKKKHQTPDIDQIPAKLITVESRIILSWIYKLVSSIWNEEELPEQRKESISVPI
jgi:hypothetical protein